MKELFKELQEKGLPIILIRDHNGGPSITLTLMVISSSYVMFGLFNGIAQLVRGIDMESALQWNMYCSALYLGRTFSKREGVGAEEKKDHE